MNDLKTVWKLWLSIGLSAVLLVLGSTLAWEGEFNFNISIGIISLERSFDKGPVTQVVLYVLAALALLYPMTCDYSKFFPDHLHMRVYFDDKGLEAALKQFTPAELRVANIHLHADWHHEKREYLNNFSATLEQMGVQEFRLTDHTVARGETTFRVSKVTAAFQTYQIYESSGYIAIADRTKVDNSAFRRTNFELRPSPQNTIHASLLDIYSPFRWTKIIRPVFGQWVQTGLETRYQAANVIGMTKVRFFPIRTIGQTIYLISVMPLIGCQNRENAEYQVPIAYTTYNPDYTGIA